jgi:hypothetical protein
MISVMGYGIQGQGHCALDENSNLKWPQKNPAANFGNHSPFLGVKYLTVTLRTKRTGFYKSRIETMQSKTNNQQNVRRQVPILLDQAVLCPVEKTLQAQVARAATKALQGRVDEQVAFARSMSFLISSD